MGLSPVPISASFSFAAGASILRRTSHLLSAIFDSAGGLFSVFSTSDISSSGGGGFLHQFLLFLREARSWVVVPALRVAVVLCLVMSVMLLVEVTTMAAISLAVNLLGRRPEKRYKWEAMSGDTEAAGGDYPMVLVQIPMYNEKELLGRSRFFRMLSSLSASANKWLTRQQVYKLSIGAACGLQWPTHRLIVQVLDDSTDPTIRDLVQLECQLWARKGTTIQYVVRNDRIGYKAGALKQGMRQSYVEDCDFVAIFDSDFQPEPDFLMKTIPFLVHNSKIALVQARWQFVNFRECMMTRIQKMTLDYHFKVEQEAGSCTFAFFGFNGTAGVWRISAINDAGGWKDRTTVEDMDLAIRATLKGWEMLYVGDVQVKSELPSTLKAYRNQQHRWTCGAAHLFRKMAVEILINKEIPVWKKFYLVYSFFFVRKIVAHIVTFVLYCIVIPLSVMFPEVSIPAWGVIYIPSTITLLNAIRNPSSIHLIPFWILFENVMSFHRMKATLVGLLETSGVDEWVVTEKLGDTERTQVEILEKSPLRLWDRLNFYELGFSLFLFGCASYDVVYGNSSYYMYIYFQAIAFLVVGCGYAGTLISNT